MNVKPRKRGASLPTGVFAVLLLFAPAVTPANAQESNEIRCRGGGFAFDTLGSRIASSGETILTMSLQFFNTSDWVQVEHLPDGQVTGGYSRLTPPSCAAIQDGPDKNSYQSISAFRFIRFETPANAQLKQRLHGSEVDTSPTAAERYPDARSIPEYLRDPNHYWSFFIVSFVGSGIPSPVSAGIPYPYVVASGHGYFKPPRVTLSPDDFKARKPSRRVVTPVGEAGTSTQDAIPTALSNRQNPQSPSRPICDIARVARARNSPAAPGLEESCRAELAAKGLAIAQEDPIVAAARTVEADNLYRQGFDIATGIFGDPALGAWGRTETGPGSLGIRDKLTLSGQRGFNASVTLHLSRKYE